MTFCQNPHWRQDLRIVVEFYCCYRWRQGGSTKQFFGTKFDDTFCISTFPSVCQSSLCTHIITKDVTKYIALPNQDLAKKVILCENCGDKFVCIALGDFVWTALVDARLNPAIKLSTHTDWLHCQNFFLSRNSVQSSTNNRSFTCCTWNPMIIFSMHVWL